MRECYEPETLKRLQQTELSMLKDFMELCDAHGLTYFGIGGTGIGALRHQGFIPWDDDIDIGMPRKDFERFLRLVKREWKGRYYILNNKTCEAYPMMTTRLCKCRTVFQEQVMKDVACPFGIFLDLYVMDNLADGVLACQVQAWSAWFFSKLLVLSCMEKPHLAQTGAKAAVIWSACKAVHRLLRFLKLRPALFRAHCEAACRKYEHKKTRRMAFLADTNPFWNVVDKEKMFPLRRLPFEEGTMVFTNDIERLLEQQYGDYRTLPPEDMRKTHFPYRLQFEEGEAICM
ncbi:MAG: LicD family protein [Lachnospiraceae bacterium]|jgi:lipopolysaccharide cholinephosphotransferase|nr:LicD family protein [Lachnospiraceae bacterium]